MTGAPGALPLAARAGGALFRARGWVPVPLAIGLALVARPPGLLLLPGLLLPIAAMVLRLWAVSHIGPGSRRRTDELGPLAATGPYARCRNPLYVGNLLLWAGLACLSGRPLAPVLVLAPLFLHYSLIVRWEEALLEARLGPAWRSWRDHTPRWLPRVRGAPSPAGGGGDWRAAWRSERSTRLAAALLAAAVLASGLARDLG